MSFVVGKSLICSFCRKQTMTTDENFPDDLHDELRQHNIAQIHWICTSCESEKGLSPKKKRMRDEIEELKAKVCQLDSELTDVKQTEIVEFRNALQELNSCVTLIKKNLEESVSVTRTHPSNVCDDIRSNEDDVDRKCDFSIVSPKRDKTALTILHSILKEKIKIDATQAANSAKVVTSFIVDSLIPALSKDELFACLYKTIYYTGSSYNDLRVSEATEYDINIILNVPKQISLMPEFYKDTSTFAKIKWDTQDEIPFNKNHVVKFLQKVSDFYILDPSKISFWLQSLIDRFVLSQPKICDVQEIKSFQSGPARTVRLSTVHGYSICIDLVPVFEFSYSALEEKPIFDILSRYPVEKSKEFWFLVPKTCQGEQLMLAHETKLSWRVHIPEIERAILHSKQCAKPVIKLLKLLRDKLNFNKLSSYCCTTVVLWELSKNQDVEYWSGIFLFDRLLEALKCLAEYLQQKNLPYFFNPQYNLFHKLNDSHCFNMNNRLNRVITSIETNSNSMKDYF